MRRAAEEAQAIPSRDSSIRPWMGVVPGGPESDRELGPQRVIAATLEYHWARARWRGSGELHAVLADVPWAAGLPRLVRQVAATVRRHVRKAPNITSGRRRRVDVLYPDGANEHLYITARARRRSTCAQSRPGAIVSGLPNGPIPCRCGGAGISWDSAASLRSVVASSCLSVLRDCGASPTSALLWASYAAATVFEMRRRLVEVTPDWGRADSALAATCLGNVTWPEGGRSWAGLVVKWSARVGRVGALAVVAARLNSTSALPTLGYTAQVHCQAPGLEDAERRAVGNALCHLGITLGRRWHVELGGAGVGRFVSAIAYVTACPPPS